MINDAHTPTHPTSPLMSSVFEPFISTRPTTASSFSFHSSHQTTTQACTHRQHQDQLGACNQHRQVLQQYWLPDEDASTTGNTSSSLQKMLLSDSSDSMLSLVDSSSTDERHGDDDSSDDGTFHLVSDRMGK